MKKKSITTPILLLLFNRPDVTRQVFEQIRKVKPSQLFIAADGARLNKTREEAKCRETRAIVEHVDWPCEIKTRFNKTNLGCRMQVSSAISWFFDQVEAGMILEDDCLPEPSFFSFCQELLEKYQDDKRVMQISGSNYLFDQVKPTASYYFSKLNDIWGWATWRRAWQQYDLEMKTYPEFKQQNQLANYFADLEMQQWLMSYFEETYANPTASVWSPQWTFAMVKNNALTIVPAQNLVKNLGIAAEATHSGSSYELYNQVKMGSLKQIDDPLFMLPNELADRVRFEITRKTDPRLLKKRWGNRLKRVGSILYYKLLNKYYSLAKKNE